jgi:hypothetical protein
VVWGDIAHETGSYICWYRCEVLEVSLAMSYRGHGRLLSSGLTLLEGM